MICLWFEQIALKNEQFTWKIHIFHIFFTVFHHFSPFLCPRTNFSCLSLLSNSLFKSDRSTIAHYKRVTMSNCFCHSWQKSESLFCSFTHKKRAIGSKNQRTNSQPCKTQWYFIMNEFLEYFQKPPVGGKFFIIFILTFGAEEFFSLTMTIWSQGNHLRKSFIKKLRAIRSQSLFCKQRQKQFTHCCSFFREQWERFAHGNFFLEQW